ncbi:MAG TPA: hypothetical protein VKB88_23590 [Bryobacteraceae bacterium]|nr:hypothetical protein [Bryobacteraceae bacterium]
MMKTAVKGTRPLSPNSWFPIQVEIEYKVIDSTRGPVAGHGLTVGMSREEIWFLLGTPVDDGAVVEVWVDWPARLESGVALQFYAQGAVRVTDNGRAALKVFRHDFRIAPKNKRSAE